MITIIRRTESIDRKRKQIEIEVVMWTGDMIKNNHVVLPFLPNFLRMHELWTDEDDMVDIIEGMNGVAIQGERGSISR